jgi:hypothetical protein
MIPWPGHAKQKSESNADVGVFMFIPDYVLLRFIPLYSSSGGLTVEEV